MNRLKKMFVLPFMILSFLTLPLKTYAVDNIPEPIVAPVTTGITTTVIDDIPEPTAVPAATENTTTTTTPVTTDITTTETTVVTTQIPTVTSVVYTTTAFVIYESAYVHSLKSPPDKTVYEIGDELDLTGLKVDLEFYDQQGGHRTIYRDAYPPDNPDFIVDTSDFDSSKAGTYKIKVSCADKFTAFYLPGPVYFEVTVNDSNPAATTTSTSTTKNTTTTTVTTTVTTEADTEQTTDAGGSVTTETSTVPPTTTTGTETTLPQTGYSKWYQVLIAAAMGMIGVGSTAIVKSGIFRKKENNS